MRLFHVSSRLTCLLLFSLACPSGMLAAGLDHFNWANVSSPQVTNAPFSVTLMAADSSNKVVSTFSGVVKIAGLISNTLPSATILGNLTFDVGAFQGPLTLGYSFTPNTNLTVTHVRHFSGIKVSIWTDAGVLLASQNVQSQEGTWLETPLSTPLVLQASNTYRVGVYTTNGYYYRNSTAPSTFSNGTLNFKYSAIGDVFPNQYPMVGYWPFVDLRYVPQISVIPVQPATSGTFTNGVWSGSLAITQTVVNVRLHADDGTNHVGDGNTFTVRANVPPVAVPDRVSALPGMPTARFNVLANDWDPQGYPIVLTGYSQPSAGTLTTLGGGSFVYTPDPSVRKGIDTFTYSISDGFGTATGIARIYIGPLLGGDWPTFGGGPQHTGYYPSSLGTNSLAPLWTNSFPLNVNQVAVGNGRVFVTSPPFSSYIYDQPLLAALDAANGAQLWQTNFSWASSMCPPTYADGKIYFQRVDNSDTQLHCVDANTGNELWTAPHGAQWDFFYAPTVVGDGVWVDGGTFGGMYGFNTRDGSQRFFAGLPQYDQWTPTYYSNALYSWVGGAFYAHDPGSGAPLWSTNLPWNFVGYAMGTVVAAQDKRAYVMAGSCLHAIDLTNHSLAWTVTNSFTGSPAVANGVVYALSGNAVQAYSSSSGALLGNYVATNDPGISGQPIVTDDALFVSSPVQTYIFNLQSFQVVQALPFGGSLSLANGTLYIGGGFQTLRAYSVDPLPFSNDLALAISAPQTAPAFQAFTYSITVSNSGPDDALGVQVTNILAANTTFVSAISTFGSCAPLNGAVVCNIGTFPAGASAMITVQIIPNAFGTLLNAARVSKSTPEPDTLNNYNEAATIVVAPVLDHFDWSTIPSPQYRGEPFAVAISAKDAYGTTLTGFNSSAALGGTLGGLNFDFENSTLAPWTPLNAGNPAGPYQLVPFDVNGDGTISQAFRLAPDSSIPDGVTQNVPLQAGVTYAMDADLAVANESAGVNAGVDWGRIYIGATQVAGTNFGTIAAYGVQRAHVHGVFTAPTNGIYALTVSFSRLYAQYSIWAYADDVHIALSNPANTFSPQSAAFTNGAWQGFITMLQPAQHFCLTSSNGAGHTGTSNPFQVLTNHIPIANSQSVLVTEDTPQPISLTASDQEHDPLVYGVVTPPTNGMLSGVPPNLTYLPGTNYWGPDYFTFRVDDGHGNSAAGQVAITVAAVTDLGYSWLAIQYPSNGQFQISLVGEPYEHYRIEASSDLVHWTTVTNLIPANDAFSFIDPDAWQFPRRYYRAVLQLASPQIIAPRVLSGNQFQFNYTGDIGRQYEVLASANLVKWDVLTTVTATDTVMTFIDSFASNYSSRFYRVRVAPH